MNIKRYTADELHGDLYYTLPDDAVYYSRADLIAAGALVPVPDGEVCAIMDCDSKYFIYNGRIYEIPDGEFYGVLVGHEGPHYTGFYGDSATIVQPIRLVPIAEAEL